MKNIIIAVLVFSFSASTFAKENKIKSNGFGEIKWGESIAKYKKVMQLTSDNRKPRKYYIRKDDEMSFGDTTLASITYIFYKGRFSSVIIQTEKSINTKEFLNKLTRKLGKPSSSNKYTNKYRWKNSTTAVSLKCYPNSHKCSVIYTSVVMNKLKKADENKK